MAKEYLMMNADQPIKSNADDKLNRASFAKNVAEAVVHYSSESSFCIGLYGEWGSGKTSSPETGKSPGMFFLCHIHTPNPLKNPPLTGERRERRKRTRKLKPKDMTGSVRWVPD